MKLSLPKSVNFLAFALGVFNGYLWLSPVFGAPTTAIYEAIDDLAVARILRVAAPLLLICFAPVRSRFRLKLFVILLLVALGLYPLVSSLARSDLAFLISSCMPLISSLVIILAFTWIKIEYAQAWVTGVSFASVCFLILGLWQGGLEPTSFFGERPRVLIGFVHPAQTAAAVLGGSIFAFLFICVHPPKSRLVRKLLAMTLSALVIWILWLSQSRNTALAAVIGVGVFLVARKSTPSTRMTILIVLLIFIWAFYFYSVWGITNSQIWYSLDDLSSGRLTLYRDAINSLSRQNIFTILVAPERYIRPILMAVDSSVYRGFSAIDSVFLTFLLNFGFIGMLMFLSLIIGLGVRLAKNPQASLAFATLCACVVFFALDGAGITTSHLSVFILFSYTVRIALTYKNDNLSLPLPLPLPLPLHRQSSVRLLPELVHLSSVK